MRYPIKSLKGYIYGDYIGYIYIYTLYNPLKGYIYINIYRDYIGY